MTKEELIREAAELGGWYAQVAIRCLLDLAPVSLDETETQPRLIAPVDGCEIDEAIKVRLGRKPEVSRYHG